MIWPDADDATALSSVKIAASRDMSCFSPFLRIESDTFVSFRIRFMTATFGRQCWIFEHGITSAGAKYYSAAINPRAF
jgi:hypothetical protein